MSITKSVASSLKKIKNPPFKKGESTWLLNHHDEKKNSFLFFKGTNYTLKKRYAIGVPLAIGAMQAEDSFERRKDYAKLGQMQDSELSNSINVTRSPNLGDYINDRDESKHTPEELAEAKGRDPIQLRDGAASGDLVFALHNLKNSRGEY